MKTKIFIVTWTSYTESDNYLYQTDRVFTDEQEAKAFYEGEMNAALDDVRGEWDEEEGEYPWTEQEDFSDFNADGNSRYQVSREVGTEDGYQIEVKFETKEIDVPLPKEIEVLYAVDTDDNTKTALLAVTAEERKDTDKTEQIEKAITDFMPSDWDDPDELAEDIHQAAEQLSCGWDTKALEGYDYEMFWDTVETA